MPADAISIISAAVVTVVTAIVGWLRARDSIEFKRIHGELTSTNRQLDEAKKERESFREELDECHKKHAESDLRATRLEVEVSFLKQHLPRSQ